MKPAAHQLSKPPVRTDSATRRMDYEDYEYYYNEDYDEDYDDYTYSDKSSSLGRRQGDFSEQEELLELAGNNRKLTKEKITKSGKNDFKNVSISITDSITHRNFYTFPPDFAPNCC